MASCDPCAWANRGLGYWVSRQMPEQRFQRLSDGYGTGKPRGQGIRQTVGTGPSGPFWVGGSRRDIEGNAQIAGAGTDFFQWHDARKAGYVLKVLVHPDDALEVILREETLRAFAGNLVDGVDEDDFATPLLRLGRAADDDAGFHR